MSSSAPGHHKNLSEEQRSLLQQFYYLLMNKLSTRPNFEPPPSVQGSYFNLSLFGSKSNTPRESTMSLSAAPDWSLALETLSLASAYDHPDSLVLRFLRARKWNIEKGVDMLVKALKWRHEFGINELLLNGEQQILKECPEELTLGKGYVWGFDKEYRRVCYIHARLHIADDSLQKIREQFAVLTVETGRLLMDPEKNETITMVFDLTGFEMKNFDNAFAKFFISCFEAYYPESLGCILVVNAPFVFNTVWSILKAMIDPYVVNKIKFIKAAELTTYIEVKDLPKSLREQLSDSDDVSSNSGDSGYVYEYCKASSKELEDTEKMHNDQETNDRLFEEYKTAAMEFLKVNFEWSQTEKTSIYEIDKEREATVQKLTKAYIKLAPYRRQKSHYHRLGMLKDPAFE